MGRRHAVLILFLYNTGATYMLSAIVQKVTGTKLVDYLGPRLFEPLGIQRPRWDETGDGVSLGGFGLHDPPNGSKCGFYSVQTGIGSGKPDSYLLVFQGGC